METDSAFNLNLEYPVSIEAILSVSFNLEGFKSVFEFILYTLRRHESMFKTHSEKLDPLSSLTDNLNEALSRLSSAEKNIKSLESQQNSLENDVKDLKDYRTSNEKFNNTTNERLENLEKQAQDNNWKELKDIVDRHEETLKEYQRFVDRMEKDLEQLGEKSEKIQKYGFETRDKVEGHGAKLIDHEKRIHKLEIDMNQALKAINSLGGEVEQISKPVDVQPAEVNVVVDNSKIEYLDDALKDLLKRLAEFEARLRSAEDHSGRAKTVAEKLESAFKNLEAEIRSLRSSRPIEATNKGSEGSSVSNADLEHLRSLIKNLESELSAKLGASDYEKSIHDILSRLEDLSSKQRVLETNISKRVLKSELDDLLKSLQNKLPSKDEPFDASRLTSLSKRIGVLEDSLLKLSLPQGYDLIMIFNLVVKLQNEAKELKEKTDKSSKDIWNKLRDLEEQLNKKASLEKLKELEDLLLSKLKELSDEFLKRFADKNETKRALKYLEKLIKDSESIKIVRDGDDAMLARKPLGGWSCASCQKDLEKLMGKIAPYHAWNKMPYRDPADRIARVGPGFSRMLATVQPELLSGRGKTSLNSPYINPNEDDDSKPFPPVKKSSDRPFTSL